MNSSALKYFSKDNSSFEDIIILDENNLDFEKAKNLAKDLPKAWYELSKISKEDRIEFSRDFCLKTLPYYPHIYSFVYDFFNSLEDLNIVLVKEKGVDFYRSQLVYSLKEDRAFFRGYPPINQDVGEINSQFQNLLPSDYLIFLKIHNGFCKNSDTGIFKAELLNDVAAEFQNLVMNKNGQIKCGSTFIDPKTLIPFYQCYGRDAFQCFYTEWFPQGEMGNVYYSGPDNAISDFKNNLNSSENLAFPTFLDWLIFYLDIIKV